MNDEKFNLALSFAAERHKGQRRKTGDIPYILHPMEVATILSGLTEDEDVIIAGLLHDTLEDTDAKPETVRELFGERVLSLVMGETEDKREGQPKEATWKIRKVESLAFLKAARDPGVKLLWLADKLANLRSVYRGYLERGDDFFNVFHQKDKNEHAWYYREVAALTAEYAHTGAHIEYEELIRKIFTGDANR